MNLILGQPRGFRRHAELVGSTGNRSNSNRLHEDVINTLRQPGEVKVSTLPGREEHIEFRQPRKLALA
jgi:hypothetical protein